MSPSRWNEALASYMVGCEPRPIYLSDAAKLCTTWTCLFMVLRDLLVRLAICLAHHVLYRVQVAAFELMFVVAWSILNDVSS